ACRPSPNNLSTNPFAYLSSAAPMRITTGSPPPRDGQIPILSTSIQPSPAAHADLPHQSAGSDSFRKDFLPLLILLLLKTPENEGMLKWLSPFSRAASFL